MRIVSQKTRHALRALLALDRDPSDDPVVVAGLAEREAIPRKFLETILLELKHAGLVRSKKGKGGGYLLARPADRITFGDVVRALEGPTAPVPCLGASSAPRCEGCQDDTACGISLIMREVHDATLSVLDRVTLSEINSRVERLRLERNRALDYSI